jgi:hypothetical protein
MQRFVLGALRAATGPLTSLEIAIEVVKGRGLDPNDPRVSLIRKRVGACLFHLRAKGLARDVAATGAIQGVRESGVNPLSTTDLEPPPSHPAGGGRLTRAYRVCSKKEVARSHLNEGREAPSDLTSLP